MINNNKAGSHEQVLTTKFSVSTFYFVFYKSYLFSISSLNRKCQKNHWKKKDVKGINFCLVSFSIGPNKKSKKILNTLSSILYNKKT